MTKAERPNQSVSAPPGAPTERPVGGGAANVAPASGKPEDVVFVHSPADHGEGYRVIRKREDKIEVGELRAVEEGRPLYGDLVRLKPREGSARLYDVEVLVDAPQPRAHGGPAQVANEAYRTNWEAIFGARPDPGLPS